MRIDCFNHFMPPRYFQRMIEIAGNHKDIGKRVRGIPCLHDLDLRLKLVDGFPDYKQILSLPVPALEDIAPPGEVAALARLANDGLAELVQKYPDHFAGFLAQAPISAPDAGVAECERATAMGAAGVQIYTNVAGKPLDRPEFEPFFAAMQELGRPIFVHPARNASSPDYADEPQSLYEIWWTFGWPYETGTFMARMVFSKLLDKYPRLKFVVHHFGGIVPMLEGRIGPGWDQLGTRTSDRDYVSLRQSLRKRPLDYFKHSFCADTAVFGAEPATACGLAFFPLENVVFASDCPFDPERGAGYIRETLRILDGLDLPPAARDAIYFGNLERLTGKTFVQR